MKARLLFATVVIAASAAFALMRRAALAEIALDFTPKQGPVAPPTQPELQGMRTVNLAEVGEPALTAFYLAAKNGRILILLHGSAADRGQLLPEAALLARHGFGILALDWPGHGESGGRVAWDEPERSALHHAVTWASARTGGEHAALGIFGFSMGSWIALQVAVNEPRIKALALAGAFADVKEALLSTKGRRFGWLVEWPTLIAARWRHLDYQHNRSIDLVASFAPRPLLLIAGSADTDVPATATAALWAAAGEPKTFWLVAGASHGQYAAVASSEYERRLNDFFAAALDPLNQ